MKKIAYRVMAVLMAAAMLLTCFVTASADGESYTVLYSLKPTPIDSKKRIYEGVVNGYDGELGESGSLVIAPEFANAYYTVKFLSIDNGAFGYDDVSNQIGEKYAGEIKEVVVSDGVKKVGKKAFINLDKLETVTFEGDVTIDDSAFEDCNNLKTVIFKGKNVTLGNNVFKGDTNLDDIQFCSDVELQVGTGCFNDTAWFSAYPTDFVVAGTTLVAYVGSDANVTLPLIVTKIGGAAFKNNKTLESVTLTKNIISLGDEAFMGCSNLKNVIFSETGDITFIGTDVFTDTAYYDTYTGDFFCINDRLIKYRGYDMYVQIPNTVKEIASGAFLGCYSKSENGGSYQISYIRIPASVELCEDGCFTIYEHPAGTPHTPVLYVYENSYAQQYLEENHIVYSVLGIPGDMDKDGVISAADARTVLRMAVQLETDHTPEEFFTADVDFNGKVTAADARMILRLAVNLENLSAEDLLYKPGTRTEIVNYLADTFKKAADSYAGFTKTVTAQWETDCRNTKGSSMDLNTYFLYWKPFIKSDSTVQNYTRTYESGTDSAKANMLSFNLVNTRAIEDADCTLRDGKYTITITMKDCEEVFGDTPIADIYPAIARSAFDAQLKSKSWTSALKNWFTFDLWYRNCSAEIVIDAKTQQIISIAMGIEYSFENIDGELYGVHVANYGRTSGKAFDTRWDTVTLNNFVY